MKNNGISQFLAKAWLLLAGSICAAAEWEPSVLGRAEGLFEVGELLYEEDFADLDDWVVQVQPKEGFPEEKVEARDGTLDCLVPGRGATIWFKKKLKTRTVISYEVVCPLPEKGMRGVEVKDVNNFWLAQDRRDGARGLFDSASYTGDFTTYNKMQGYYASTGGGRNTTTRMRRYPREDRGRPIKHIALKERDGQEEFLIPPGKTMRVELVAFDDLVQYIVDGKLVYEMSFGDEVAVERVRRGQRMDGIDDYDDDDFPFYREGFFGFRMVGTHHVYSQFRVHALKAIDVPEDERVEVKVSSLEELRAVMGKSNQSVVMTPGTYVVEDVPKGQVGFNFRGSRNTFDFTGVTIEMPLKTLDQLAGRRGSVRGYLITGHEVTFKGGLFVNTYPHAMEEPIDFGPYNQDPDNAPQITTHELHVKGDDVRLEGVEMIVRGSYPYGYGNMYGIGATRVLTLRKHCGILIHGDRAVVDGCVVKMEAFGHGIFMQYADETLVKNCLVTGGVRPSNDFLAEDGQGDLGVKFDHQIQWPEEVHGVDVPRDHMINLTEDGIRAYGGTGRVTVENCKVVGMRGGIKIYMAKKGIIRNCEVRDCVVQGFSVPNRGVIENCRGNAAYGPLLYIHSDSHHSQRIEIEVLPAPHGIGDHPLAAIRGKGHSITFKAGKGTGAQIDRPIIVGYPLRFDYLSKDYPKVPAGMEEHFKRFAPEDYTAEKIQLTNQTSYPVVLGEHAQHNRVQSEGEVRDLGAENAISRL